VLPVQADITNSAEIAALFAEVRTLDFLILNASGGMENCKPEAVSGIRIAPGLGALSENAIHSCFQPQLQRGHPQRFANVGRKARFARIYRASRFVLCSLKVSILTLWVPLLRRASL
jgi:hypothetical protein